MDTAHQPVTALSICYLLAEVESAFQMDDIPAMQQLKADELERHHCKKCSSPWALSSVTMCGKEQLQHLLRKLLQLMGLRRGQTTLSPLLYLQRCLVVETQDQFLSRL